MRVALLRSFVALAPGVTAAGPTWFAGAQLMVTAEPREDGDLHVSINTVPLVVEWAASDRVGLRLSSLLNLDLGEGELGQAGAGLTVPLYLTDGAPTDTWYVGPSATLSEFVHEPVQDLTLAAEAGYRFRIGERWMFNVAMQLGATWIDDSEPGWVNHFGLYPSVGYWFGGG